MMFTKQLKIFEYPSLHSTHMDPCMHSFACVGISWWFSVAIDGIKSPKNFSNVFSCLWETDFFDYSCFLNEPFKYGSDKSKLSKDFLNTIQKFSRVTWKNSQVPKVHFAATYKLAYHVNATLKIKRKLISTLKTRQKFGLIIKLIVYENIYKKWATFFKFRVK